MRVKIQFKRLPNFIWTVMTFYKDNLQMKNIVCIYFDEKYRR